MSAPLSLDKKDLTKLFKSAILSAVGGGATIFIQKISDQNWGMYTPMVAALAIFLTNLVRKFLFKTA